MFTSKSEVLINALQRPYCRLFATLYVRHVCNDFMVCPNKITHPTPKMSWAALREIGPRPDTPFICILSRSKHKYSSIGYAAVLCFFSEVVFNSLLPNANADFDPDKVYLCYPDNQKQYLTLLLLNFSSTIFTAIWSWMNWWSIMAWISRVIIFISISYLKM